jgi:ketosteroid isomerase-like protein
MEPSSPGSCPPPPPSADPPGGQEVIAANDGFYTAFEALDLTAMSLIWSEQAPISCVHPGWTLVAGRAPVLASWAGIFRGTERIKFALHDVQVFISNGVAWVVLIEEIEAQQGEQVVHAYAHATNLFLLEDGAWRLVHHHAAPTAMPPPDKPAISKRTLH